MPLRPDVRLSAVKLLPKIERLLDLSAAKILNLEKTWKPDRGTPVFTENGHYTSRAWTEWTRGFQFGSPLLQFEATGDLRFLELGRRRTLEQMVSHLTHLGVHDHGFNHISTHGTLWRLGRSGVIDLPPAELAHCETALRVSGAVQAARWSHTADGLGFIYSFNGPHSLFIDTLRSLRSLGLAHRLGHVLLGERDVRISLLQRLLQHALASARYAVFYGEGRDAYDVRGRTAHESLFNPNDGVYRCPNSQQGYSPFTTWTRGLAWAILGFAEELEFLASVTDTEIKTALSETDSASAQRPRTSRATPSITAAEVRRELEQAAFATADYYLEVCCADGIPMWDTGAPNLHRLGDYQDRASDPFNAWEPVDSSAAAIAAQGLLRLGNYIDPTHRNRRAKACRQAAFTIADALFSEPYLAKNPRHQGLILHSVYHRPNGWDHIRPGQKVPNGESSMWGDYHARELAVMLHAEAKGKPCTYYFRA